MPTPDDVKNALKQVIDPELNLDIITLSLVYDVKVDEDKVIIDMTLTTPMCPYGPQLIEDVKQTTGKLDGVKNVIVNLVWDPPWGPDVLSEEAKMALGIN